MDERILVGIDTGGTFTDFVLLKDGVLSDCKVLSTPSDPSAAIAEGLQRLGLEHVALSIVHGTTVGTNAVLEGKGAKVAYVTSEGFGDVLTLGRQERSAVYQLRQPEIEPPVPAPLCMEVSSRGEADGTLSSPASNDDLAALKARLETLAIESIAINLIYSFLCPGEEQRIARALGKTWFISCSSDVLPEAREYERGIATWLNASVGPVIQRYLWRLAKRSPRARISVMQSAGTTIEADQAARDAARLLLSGPAGGLAAAKAIGAVTGDERLLTFDMGGTSTDVSLLDGDIPLTGACRIGSYPLAIRSVDMHTIGAGGGSIARLDAAGVLLVGPESAGADPGPACYARGGIEATVTDANVVLGRIPPETRLGGYLPLDAGMARAALTRLADAMGCDALEAARGVIRVANERMARALRVMSVARGHDPRDYNLFCFGGAGGLHACDLADLLNMNRVMLPASSGVLSALGMLVARPGRQLSHAILEPLKYVTDKQLGALFSQLEERAGAELSAEGVEFRSIRFRRELELRYHGQSAVLTLGFQPGADHAERFHQAHESAFGHRLRQDIELANLRLGAWGPPALDAVPRRGLTGHGTGRPVWKPPVSTRVAGFDREVPLIDREAMAPGDSVTGPAVITETAATAWVAEGWRGEIDAWENLCLER